MDTPTNPVTPATSTTRPHGQRGAFSQAEHDENVGFSRLFAAADYLPEDAEGITAPRIDTATATTLATQGPGDLDAMLYPAPVAPAPVVKPEPSPGDAPMAFGAAFNRARSKGLKEFTWKGKSYTTQTREEVTPQAPDPSPTPQAANLSDALRNGGYTVPERAPLTTRPAIVEELRRMRDRRTGAGGTWDAPGAPTASQHGARGTLRAMGQVYPVVETAANLATQAVALPVAGLAGIGAIAGNAMGADLDPAATVHNVGQALTYQPRTELGQHLARAAMYPFEKLHEGATAAGNATLAATGSPGAATAIHTLIEGVAPMAIVPGARALRREPQAPMPRHRAEDIHLGDLPPSDIALDTSAPAGPARRGLSGVTSPDDIRLDPAPAAPRPGITLDDAPAPRGAEASPAPVDAGTIGGKPLTGMSDGMLDGLARSDGLLSDAAKARVQGELARRETQAPRPEEPTPRADFGEFSGRPLADMSDRLLNRLADSPNISESARARMVAELTQRQRAARTVEPDARAIAVADERPPVDLAPSVPTLEPRVPATYYRDDNGVMWAIPYEMRPGQQPRDIKPEFRGEWVRLSGRTFMQDPVWGPVERNAPRLGDGEWLPADELSPTPPKPTPIAPPDYGGTPPNLVPDEPLRTLAQSGDDAARAELARRGLMERTHGDTPRIDADALATYDQHVREPGASEVSGLRWTRDNGLSPMAPVRELPGGRGSAPEAGNVAGAAGRERPIQPGELLLDDTRGADQPAPQHATHRSDAAIQRGPADGDAAAHTAHPFAEREAAPGAGAALADRQWRDLAPARMGEAARPAPGAVGATFAKGHPPGEGLATGRPAFAEGIPRDVAPEAASRHASGPWRESPEVRLSPAPEPVKLGGRPIDQYRMDALERVLQGKTLSAPARRKVEAELARRTRPVETLDTKQPDTLNGPPGAAYAGFVDDARLPASKAATAADLAQPIRREHVIKDFARAIGAHVYEGRMGEARKALGFFRPKNEEVRIKHANDIETTAHEIAHLIDSRVPEIAQTWTKPGPLTDTFRAELRGVSYDGSKLKEGFAEFMRLRLTQPDEAAARAPEFSKWFDAFEARHEYGPAIRKAQADMTSWFAQDALNRARSKIGSKTRLSDRLGGVFDRFRQSALDDLHGVYKMERELSGKIEPRGPYESARLTRASASLADGAIRFGHPVVKPNGAFTFAGPGLEQILRPVSKNLEDTLLYFVGESAHELMGQGREHLFRPSEIAAMRALRTPERAKAFAEYQAWNQGVLDFAEHHGIINPQTRKAWQRTQYLPFSRVGQPGTFKAKPGDWNVIRALTGGTENIRDVLPNMIGNAARLIDAATKNDARNRIAALAENRKGGRFMVRIPPESRPVTVDKAQLIDAVIGAMGLNRKDPRAARIITELNQLPTAFIELMQGGQPPAGSNVVAVLRGGKKQWFEVGDPLLLRALESIDRPYQHWLIQWLGLPKRVGQASITLTPDFWAANLARDTVMGSIMSRAGFRIGLDSLKGMRLRMTSDPVYKDYIANGGGLSSIYLDETQLRAKLERFYDRQGIDYRTVLDSPQKLLGAIETLGDAFEMSTRLGEYKRAIDAGEHPRHAAYLGREVSTDFAMRGDSKSLGVAFDTIMFLKAAVVSWDRLARGLAHDPNRGAIAVKAAALAGASVALYMTNRDDPRYQDLPDWDRDSNWHFFVGDQHFRYPKIWEVGALASGAERMAEKTIAEDPEGLGEDFARIASHTFSVNLTPQIVAPLVEQAANKRFFTGTPIESEGMDDLIPALRAKPSTSETLRQLGEATIDLPEALQVNPVRAEALLRGYLNTWAAYGLMLSDLALYGDQLPSKRLDEIPVLRRFVGAEPTRHTKYEKEFYDLLGESIRMRRTLNALEEQGKIEQADKLLAKRPDIVGEAKWMQRNARWSADLNKQMAEVRRDRRLTPDQKRTQIDQLITERNRLLKEVVKELKP